MKFTPSYLGYSPEIACEPFAASVPGNIQLDYLNAHPEFLGGDINFGDNFRKMYDLEPYTWFYKTTVAGNHRSFKMASSEQARYILRFLQPQP